MLASPGASFANLASNITSVLSGLPAALQTYWDIISDRASDANQYVQSTTGLSPTVLYTTVGAILLLGAIPAVTARNGQGNRKPGRMRRYGFSRGGLSPFSSTLGEDGVPSVTDEDFSYITSADLEDPGLDIPRRYIPHTRIIDHYSHSAPSPAYTRHIPEDDVMLIKHQGITYPEHFPAYSIGDGQLLVRDVRERVKIILDLTDSEAKRVKLYYKGRRLRNPDKPVREYGVKNNSEVLMVLAEPSHGSDSESSEEVVVVGGRRSRRSGQAESPRVGRSGGWDERSPRESGSQVGRDAPTDGTGRRGTSKVRTESPSGSNFSAASAPAGVPGGPLEKLNEIANHFNSKLLPLCMEFVAKPPVDPKKRDEEHRKLSETVMQQVILKLDAVETSGEEGARARRKELVKHVQAVLKEVDDAKR